MQLITRLRELLCRDRRPDWVQKQERDFIDAVNSLNLHTKENHGGFALDPDEIRALVVASYQKHLVHNRAETAAEDDTQLTGEINGDIPDCFELVTWRRLPSGAAARFVCLQSLVTGKFAVAAVNTFSDEGVPASSWMNAEAHRQVVGALLLTELQWYESVGAAMDAWAAP